jgi:hypothetical protein
MEIVTLPNFNLKPELLSSRLRVDKDSLTRLTKSFSKTMDIKAAYRVCFLDQKYEDRVVVDGVEFISRVLAKNVSGAGKVFPFILTLGPAVDKLIDETKDLLDNYLLDLIGNICLHHSRQEFENHLLMNFGLEKISSMAPGSLKDWPITEQKNLFALFEGIESALSVRLTDSCLMVPRKSVSGIYFPTKTSFYSCQLCPREKCTGRKAPFDESKRQEYGI